LFDNPVLLELGMESDIKIFTDIIKKKYPKTNFAYGIGGVKFIIVYSDDSNCKEFCENIRNWMGKPFKINYESEESYNQMIFRKRNRTIELFDVITSVINWVVMLPISFSIYSYYRISKWVKKTLT